MNLCALRWLLEGDLGLGAKHTLGAMTFENRD